MRVAVAIPTWCEADSVAHVTAQVDRGLSARFDPADCLIVNADGASPDRTAEVFRGVSTLCPKHALEVRGRPGGKGRNLLAFLAHARSRGYQALATVDGDLRSIEPFWVDALLGPVVSRRADYVVPQYRRSRYDGATTNHFAFPILHGVLGHDIRQPIGGEFALGAELADRILLEEPSRSALGYGIDFFLTLHAAAGGWRIARASLGCKRHASSFEKRPRIFREVVGTALPLLHRFGLGAPHRKRPREDEAGIEDERGFEQAGDAARLRREARLEALTHAACYRAWLAGAPDLDRALAEDRPTVSRDLWARLLAGQVRLALAARPADPEAWADRLYPVYMLRAATFWEEAADWEPARVEREIVTQARSFAEALVGPTAYNAA